MTFIYKGFLLQQAVNELGGIPCENMTSVTFATELKLSIGDSVVIDNIRYKVAELNYLINPMNVNMDKIDVEILLVYRYQEGSKGNKCSFDMSYLDRINRSNTKEDKIDSDLDQILSTGILASAAAYPELQDATIEEKPHSHLSSGALSDEEYENFIRAFEGDGC